MTLDLGNLEKKEWTLQQRLIEHYSKVNASSNLLKLPSEFLYSCMHNLMSVEDVLAASTTEHTARSVIWNARSAEDLWKALTVHSLGKNALALAMQALPVHASPEIYCNALHLRKLFRKTLSIVRGSTADLELCGKFFEVAVCP